MKKRKSKEAIFLIGCLVFVILMGAIGVIVEGVFRSTTTSSSGSGTGTSNDKGFRITSMADVPSSTYDKALSYVEEDLTARIYNITYGDGVNLDMMLNKALSYDSSYVDTNIARACEASLLQEQSLQNNSSIALKESFLMLPKEDAKKNGYLEFVFEVTIDLAGNTNYCGNNVREESCNITFYTCYDYDISLENEECVIIDYNAFRRGDIQDIDVDYDNFFNKVFIARKGDFEIVKGNAPATSED